jgi:broad specificity phosphatase PhoE
LANTQNLVCGRLDFDLSLKGIEQSKSRACKFSSLKVNQRVICSPLLRARQTANLLFPNTLIEVDENLIELDTGDYSNLNYDELYECDSRYKVLGQANICFPKGESIFEMEKRVRLFLGNVDLICEDELIIITHSGVINMFLHVLLEIPLLKFPAFTLQNCSSSVVSYDPGLMSWRVEGVNIYE